MTLPHESLLILLREAVAEPPIVVLDDEAISVPPDTGPHGGQGNASAFTSRDRQRVLQEAWEIVFGPEDRDPVIVLPDHEYDSLFS